MNKFACKMTPRPANTPLEEDRRLFIPPPHTPPIHISVICPVYNAESFIKRTFDSVENNTYKNMECIFIDDCSGDNSVKILENMIVNSKSGIHYDLIKCEQNAGRCAARNTGILHAAGEYICFLDNDDWYGDNAFSEMAALAEKYHDVDMVVCNTNHAYENGEIRNSECAAQLQEEDEYTQDTQKIQLLQFKIQKMPAIWGKLIKRELVIKNNIFFKDMKMHEDVLFSFFVFKYLKSLAVCKNAFYNWFIRRDSESHGRGSAMKSALGALDFIEISLKNLDIEILDYSINFAYLMLTRYLESIKNLEERNILLPRAIKIMKIIKEAIQRYNIKLAPI